jgi:hypothetical protein
MTKPNFLYIGTSKAGSTWIFKALSWHPQIHMYGGKDLRFFTDEYEKGWDWYVDQFHPNPSQTIIGEVSHAYLASEEACERIHKHLPDTKLMVCLREPVSRTFSQYLDGLKNGKMHGSLDEELVRTPSLAERNRYGTHVQRYLDRFPREQLHIASFDELVSSPASFAAKMFEFLGVEPLVLPEKEREKVLPAGTPRSRAVAQASKKVVKAADFVGLPQLRGALKKSRFVRNLLYRPYAPGEKPTLPPEKREELRQMFAPEIRHLDRIAGTNFCELWNYQLEDV